MGFIGKWVNRMGSKIYFRVDFMPGWGQPPWIPRAAATTRRGTAQGAQQIPREQRYEHPAETGHAAGHPDKIRKTSGKKCKWTAAEMGRSAEEWKNSAAKFGNSAAEFSDSAAETHAVCNCPEGISTKNLSDTHKII